jgi:membrane protease YdiL (CAAX protease family)
METTTRERIASPLHTGVILAALLLFDAAAVVMRVLRGTAEFVGSSGRLPLYAEIVAIQLLVLIAVASGTRSLRDLIVPAPPSRWRWLRYVAIGIGGWIVWMIISSALAQVLRPSAAELRALMQFLPKNITERLCWVGFVVVTTACEEAIYRGYFLRQFEAMLRSATAAVVLQAAVYAAGHAALGTALVVSVALLGVWLGVLTIWQKSIVPAMIVHAGVGLLGAFSP